MRKVIVISLIFLAILAHSVQSLTPGTEKTQPIPPQPGNTEQPTLVINVSNTSLEAKLIATARTLNLHYTTTLKEQAITRLLRKPIILVLDSARAAKTSCSTIHMLLTQGSSILVFGKKPLESLLGHCKNLNLTLLIKSQGGAPIKAAALSATPTPSGALAPSYRVYGTAASIEKILADEIQLLYENKLPTNPIKSKTSKQTLDATLPMEESFLTWYYVGELRSVGIPIYCRLENIIIGAREFLAGYANLKVLFASAEVKEANYGIPYEFKIGVEEWIDPADSGITMLPPNPVLPIRTPFGWIGTASKISLYLGPEDETIDETVPLYDEGGPWYLVLRYLKQIYDSISSGSFPLDTDGWIEVVPHRYKIYSSFYEGFRDYMGVFEWGQKPPILRPHDSGKVGVAYYVMSFEPLLARLNVTASMVYIGSSLWNPFSTHSCIVYRWFDVEAYHGGPLYVNNSGGGSRP